MTTRLIRSISPRSASTPRKSRRTACTCASQARAGIALTLGRPATPAALFRKSLARRIHKWHHAYPFDAIYTFCSGMLPYAAGLLNAPQNTPSPRPQHLLDLVDVDSAKWAAYASNHRGLRRLIYAAEARRLQPLEAGLTCPVDHLLVTAPREAQLYRQTVAPLRQSANPSPSFPTPTLHVLPNGVALPELTRPCASRPASCDLLFVGVLDYPPNTDAVRRFALDILPLIQHHLPAATFTVVGRRPIPAITRLGRTPGVRIVGPVDDLQPWYAQAAAAVVPLRIARGIQNKILEALAHRCPVVCTPAAAAGLPESNAPLRCAETPADFAAACLTLLQHPVDRDALAEAGRRFVTDHYAWPTQLAPLRHLLESPDTARTNRHAA